MYLFSERIFKSEDYDKALALIKELVKESQKEEGCIVYEVYKSLKKENALCIYEEWQEGDYLTKHQQTKHFQELVPQIGELAVEASPLYVYGKID